jgi:hypothetical protein
MESPKRLRLDLYPDRDLILRLDRWRIEQPDAPSRAEAARRLLDEALAAKSARQSARRRKAAKLTPIRVAGEDVRTWKFNRDELYEDC